MILDIFIFGALRVILDAQTGTVQAVQSRITGAAAQGEFSPDYISRAITAARLAWASTADA